MSVLNQNTLIGASGTVAAGGGGGGGGGAYTIDNSLRFNDDDNPTLSRTPSVSGNRKIWTWSGWVKYSMFDNSSNNQAVFSAWDSTADLSGILFSQSANTPHQLQVYNAGSQITTTQLFRDPSAWYHIVATVDTTQATASNRTKLYINGVIVTDLSITNYPAQNTDTAMNNIGAPHKFGEQVHSSTLNRHLDGYLAEVNFIDGLALTPSSFGEFGTYGEWKPLAYTGSYGTNGFYLDFANSGDLGNDVSGNANDWTPTNLAATDQMLDSPTNNFATLNPLCEQRDGSLLEGNLEWSFATSAWGGQRANVASSTGSWYWEYLLKVRGNSVYLGVVEATTSGDLVGSHTNSVAYTKDGDTLINNTYTGGNATYATGDIIGFALDMDTGDIAFYKNNVVQTTVLLPVGGEWLPMFSAHGSTAHTGNVNFGQDSSFAGNKTAQGNSDSNGIGDFYYAPPAGFLALCTQNLPEPTVIPSEHFNTVLYTGDDTVRTIDVGFQPDLVWGKTRGVVDQHTLTDSVRGASLWSSSSTTQAEFDYTAITGGINSFLSNGFTLGNDVSELFNATGRTYAAWNWKANGAGVSNTDGTITSTVSANVDAGFSIISYTGTGVAATVGHGLSVAPETIIIKRRSGVAINWVNYHVGIGAGAAVYLDSTTAQITAYNFFQDTAPTSSLVSIGIGNGINTNAENYIAYAFHSVDGYSKVGSYTGNSSTDGVFVHCGFRPAYVMVKRTDAAQNWTIYDSSRDIYNSATKEIYANLSNGEASYPAGQGYDFLSNGFKLRNTSTDNNANGGSYIFLAFAESPMKYSNAR